MYSYNDYYTVITQEIIKEKNIDILIKEKEYSFEI